MNEIESINLIQEYHQNLDDLMSIAKALQKQISDDEKNFANLSGNEEFPIIQQEDGNDKDDKLRGEFELYQLLELNNL